MFHIRITVELVDEKTGEVAKSRHGGQPVMWKTAFFPLFDNSSDGEAPTHRLYETACSAMHLASDFYRVGGIQKDL